MWHLNVWFMLISVKHLSHIITYLSHIITFLSHLLTNMTCHMLLPTCNTLLPTCNTLLPACNTSLPACHTLLPSCHTVTCSYLYVPVTCYYLPVTQDCWTLCSHGPRTRWWGWKHWPAGPTEDAHSVNGKRMKLCIIQIKLDIILLFLGYNH